jgi:hypothetical protein
MARPVRLFVCSSPDLAAEREALGQVAAELPINVGWEIKHTPGPLDDSAEALAFLDSCDLFVLILGSDFAAPMGLEYQRAQGAGMPFMAYRRRAMVSPSAKSLLRQSHLDWSGFDDTAQFRVLVKAHLGRAILDRAEYFGLRLPEVEALLAELEEDGTEDVDEPDTRRGAERGGVILGVPG